jgi:type II secretory pathway pseudopilin PulG
VIAVKETLRAMEPGPGAAAPGQTEAGYNLVILVFFILLANIAIAAALPTWSKAIQRDKEEELIFRGMQYAEAIRIFQSRFGRAPVRLEELLEVEPRSIRQLFPNPMTEDGAWGLLLQGGAPGAGQVPRVAPPGRNPNEPPMAPGDPRRLQGLPAAPPGPGGGPNRGGAIVAVPPSKELDVFGGRRAQVTTGPIVGVYAAVSEASLKTFFGKSDYESWYFTVDLVPVPVMTGGDAPLPRANSSLVGRPFREDLQPQLPGAGFRPQGQELTGASAPGSPAQRPEPSPADEREP